MLTEDAHQTISEESVCIFPAVKNNIPDKCLYVFLVCLYLPRKQGLEFAGLLGILNSSGHTFHTSFYIKFRRKPTSFRWWDECANCY